MKRLIRPILTALLLLSFASENVALSAVLSDKMHDASHGRGIVQQKVQAFFSLLAEENEERDHKDHGECPLSREVIYIHQFPLVGVSKVNTDRDSRPVLRPLPIYTYHCSLII